jgi:hypothetical protein
MVLLIKRWIRMKFRVSYNIGLNGFEFLASSEEEALNIAKKYEKQYGSIRFLDRIEEFRIYNRGE